MFILAAAHCEFDIWNWQIFPQYSHNLDQQEYLHLVFKGYIQLVPSILFAPIPQAVWIATNSLAIFTAAEDCFQLVLKYELKVKLERR